MFTSGMNNGDFEEFSGQDKIIENLKIFVKAALLRGEALDHSSGERPWIIFFCTGLRDWERLLLLI